MAPKVLQTPKAVWTKAADKKLIEEVLIQCQKGKKLTMDLKRRFGRKL